MTRKKSNIYKKHKFVAGSLWKYPETLRQKHSWVSIMLLMHCNSCFKHHLLGWDAVHLCTTRQGHWHPNTQTRVTGRTALKHKLAPRHFPTEPQITLMSTHSTCRTRTCFHNRWQEAPAASTDNWAAGSFIYYQLCPVSINHLHLAALWLRCHSRPQCGWHAGKQWGC